MACNSIFCGAFISLLLFLTTLILLAPLVLDGSMADPTFFSPHLLITPNASKPLPALPVARPPLRTSGREILDADGHSVQIQSVNWYGGSDIHFIPSGLDIQHRDDISALIRRIGFNSVRLPYSDEMVMTNPAVEPALLAANPDLVGKTALEVYHAVVRSLTGRGLLVIPNDHITQATWCCGANPCDGQWRNDFLGPICRVKLSEEQWIKNWEAVMTPLRDDKLVIGADLRNEVRALWGTLRWETWARAAEQCSERLLAINPDWLMIVEGLSSANDLRGVAARPVKLSIPDKVVYSAHVYAWSGWGELNPYSQSTYERFAIAMRKNWAYLLLDNVAPVWLGEFGTAGQPSTGDRNYWTHLMRFLKELGNVSFGYWAINPRKAQDNVAEGYGLVDDAWQKVLWDYRLQDLQNLGLNTTLLH